MLRIGIGTDTHRLVEGRQLVLGGVHIASDRGADGHSDADALAPAIADAILRALCEGDIGVHFPDKDPQWSGASSLDLLSRVMWLARERSLHVVNVDSTILLEQDGRINVDHVETAFARQPHHARQQIQTTRATPLWILVGKMNSNITFAQRAENRVGNRMGEGIRIRMTISATIRRDMHPPEHKLTPFH